MGSSDNDDSLRPPAGAERAAVQAQLMKDLARGGWSELLGFELMLLSAGEVVIEWTVDQRHLQPQGIVHGGVYASVVESCCSLGAALAAPPGKLVVGVENHTSFIRPVREGRLRARATPLHAGRRAQLWECNISDLAQRLIATGRLRLMCVDPERGASSER